VTGRRDTNPAIGDLTPAHHSGKQSSEEVARALLACIAAGDRCAIEELYVLYFSRLAKFFLYLNVRADCVEELIIDTMTEVWKKGASIEADTSISIAMMRLAYSHGQKHFAEATNQQVSPPTFSFEQRILLYLVYGCGHSRREIADMMNVSCECVDRLLGDARRRHG
jgi:DNA-directed RNA polymerase specialized sigma24 family protein